MAQQLTARLASPELQLRVLLGVAVAFGGGGVGFGLRNLAVQLTALVVLALQWPQVVQFCQQAPRGLLALVGLTLALPLAQLIPLPPDMWQALPGRALAATAVALAGLPADTWLPLSLDRGRTLTAFVGLIPAATIVLVAATLPNAARAGLARFAGFAALGALLLGVFQLSTANTAALLFPITAKPDVLYATFANRNSTAAFFVIALLLLASAPWWRERLALLAAVVGGVLLALGTILTQSRSGMVLLVLALAFAALRAVLTWLGRKRAVAPLPRPVWIGTALLAMLLAGAVLASASLSGRTAASLARFGDTDTDRPEMWEDALFAAGEYWPVGSGMGTFDEVFQAHESLEYISPRRAGRAHSDVIEIMIEGGAASAALVLGWLAWCAAAVLRSPLSWRWPALGAGAGVLALLLQSLLDYPLRNQSVLCMAAVLVVVLAGARGRRA